HLLRLAADNLGSDGRHAVGVVQAALAGASVGIPGADDDAARVPGRQSLAANVHRGGGDAILREGAGGGGGHLADHQRQVEALGVGTDATVNAGIAVTVGQVPVGRVHVAIPRGVRARIHVIKTKELVETQVSLVSLLSGRADPRTQSAYVVRGELWPQHI